MRITFLFFIVIGLSSILLAPSSQRAASKKSPAGARAMGSANFVTTNEPATSTVTASGLALAPAAVNFGYQLVGATSSPLLETVTNSGPASTVITDISVLGRNRSDFDLTYSFNLPVILAAGESVAINLMFTAAAPWRAGTRDAKLEIQHTHGVDFVALTGIGATCGGPIPSCSSACADSDDDGLNDAWEIAGGVDLNNDGRVDAMDDLLLPGADPNRPDVYLKYDYMVATNTSPIGTPPHSHQPSDKAIQQVVEAFASHGVALHIDEQHDAISEVLVTTLDPNPAIACAGNDFVTMRTLRQQHFGNRKWAYHYAVFGHNAVLPDTGDGSNCPQDKECLAYPDPLSSGSSELPGSSFIVAFGADVDQGNFIGVETVAGTFMHELGHNFGLRHGSLAAPGPQACMAFKPNYVSVMDYMYQSSGIGVADQPGSKAPKVCSSDGDCPIGSHCTDDLGSGGGNVCYRVDYSHEKLLDLNEWDLNETVGVGGLPTDTDLVNYIVDLPGLFAFLHGSSYGPIDWNGNGQATESSVQVDIDNDSGTPNTMLLTANDWETANGLFTHLNFKFQCTTAFARDSGGGSAAPEESSTSPGELSLAYAREHHMLYPLAAVSIVLNPASANFNLKPPAVDTAELALLGSANFDVNQVDLASLNVHGARPFAVSVGDVNGDGIADLVLQVRKSDMWLSGTRLQLTGWQKNSRAFVGTVQTVSDCPG